MAVARGQRFRISGPSTSSVDLLSGFTVGTRVLTLRVDERTDDVLKRRLRRRDETGTAAVEFALIMIPFAVMLFGLIEYGWYFYVGQNTSGAASTVTRKLEVGDCWASGQALTFAKNQSAEITTLTTSPSPGASPTPGTAFTVTITANANILNFLPVPNGGTITRTVSAQVEDDKVSSC
jgi:Flp pilus assembly protein TadG